MVKSQIFYILLSIISLSSAFLMIYLAFYTWKKHWVTKHLDVARYTVLLMLLASFWLFGLAAQILNQSPEISYLLEKILYFPPLLIGPTWLLLALRWTGRHRRVSSKLIVFLFLIPFLFWILILTNDFHDLFLRNISFITKNSLLVLKADHTIYWWFITGFSYFLILIGVFILVRGLFNLRHIYRKHASVLLIGTLTPLFVNIFYNLYLIDFVYYDISAIFFVITGIAYYWGLSRLKLIDIIPIARDAIFENMNDPVFIFDTQNRIVDINPSFKEIFGIKKSIIGEKTDDVFSDNKRILNILKKEKDVKSEIMLLLDDGIHYYDIDVKTFYDDHGNQSGKLVSLRDITSRKYMEKELRKLNEELEERVKKRTAEIEKLLRQKEDFIWQLGHDLKTPLTPMIGLLPTIKKKIEDPKLLELIKVLEGNVDYLKNLVFKTLEFERLGSKSFELKIEKINPYEIIKEVIISKKTMLEDKKLRIENRVDNKFFLHADKLQIKELFDNLISNSIKYTEENDSITIDSKEGKDFIKFSVSDTGMGLSSEEIKKIFDEFYKVDQSRHDLHSTGLGLAICKRIVKRHKGSIWVESAGKGKGATFFVKIPKFLGKK